MTTPDLVGVLVEMGPIGTEWESILQMQFSQSQNRQTAPLPSLVRLPQDVRFSLLVF